MSKVASSKDWDRFYEKEMPAIEEAFRHRVVFDEPSVEGVQVFRITFIPPKGRVWAWHSTNIPQSEDHRRYMLELALESLPDEG